MNKLQIVVNGQDAKHPAEIEILCAVSPKEPHYVITFVDRTDAHPIAEPLLFTSPDDMIVEMQRQGITALEIPVGVGTTRRMLSADELDALQSGHGRSMLGGHVGTRSTEED